MRHRQNVTIPVLALAAAVLALAPFVLANGAGQTVTEKLLLDNEQVMVFEFIFPPGFRGEEHAAAANEFAYVLEGEFAVVTQGKGKRVVRKGEIEYASKGTIHSSLNEAKRPARVLVTLIK